MNNLQKGGPENTNKGKSETSVDVTITNVTSRNSLELHMQVILLINQFIQITGRPFQIQSKRLNSELLIFPGKH